MNIAPRIVTLRKLEPKFNRTEFKVLFALAAGAQPMTKEMLQATTGLGAGRVKDSLKDLMYHNVVIENGKQYDYNDAVDTWKVDLLNKRQLYVSGSPRTAGA